MDPSTLRKLEAARMKKRKLSAILPSKGSGPADSGSSASTLPFSTPVAPSSAGDVPKEVLPVERAPSSAREDAALPAEDESTGALPRMGTVHAVPTEMGFFPIPALEKFRENLGHLHESLGQGEWGSSLDQRVEGAEGQMTNLLRSFAQLGDCLSQVIEASSETPSLPLRIAKEKAEDLQYYLEQEKAATAQLTKELETSEEALHEAQETIFRRGIDLRKAEDKVDELRAQRHDARRGCRLAYAEMKRLKATLTANPNSPTPRGRFWRKSAPLSHEPISEAPTPLVTAAEEKIEKLEKELQEGRVELRRLKARFVREEYTLATAQRGEARFILKGVSIIDSACKSAFSAGFERCKKMIQDSSEAGALGQPQVDFSDRCLKAVIDDNTETFRALSFISASTAEAPSCSVKEGEEGAKTTEE